MKTKNENKNKNKIEFVLFLFCYENDKQYKSFTYYLKKNEVLIIMKSLQYT